MSSIFYHKKIIIFDLDGTLTESRTPMTETMKEVFTKLLQKYYVAVISGGLFSQFEKQIINPLSKTEVMGNLFILPSNGTSLYHFENGWKVLYQDVMPEEEKKEIKQAILRAIKECGIEKTFKEKKGEIQDREGQVSLSIMNPDWNLQEKKAFDPDYAKRIPIRDFLQALLPECEIKIGGTTTIDVTRKGVDKGTAVKRILSHLKLVPEDALFVGDAIFPGGNDYAASLVVESVKVTDPKETEKVIKSLIN